MRHVSCPRSYTEVGAHSGPSASKHTEFTIPMLKQYEGKQRCPRLASDREGRTGRYDGWRIAHGKKQCGKDGVATVMLRA